MEEPNTTIELSESNINEEPSNEKKVKWTEKDIKLLLSFLKKHKEVLKELVKKRGGSGNIKNIYVNVLQIRYPIMKTSIFLSSTNLSGKY